MGVHYLTLACPYCQRVNSYTPESYVSTVQCEYCGKEFSITDDFVKYTAEIARDTKALEDLKASFRKPLVPQPVISQLAIAIEETLIVYHEPYFIRWACRALQGIVDRNFSPIKYMTDEVACSWAGRAATECISASRQLVPGFLIEDAAAAIECALRAQDVVARTQEKGNEKDE